MLLDDWRVDWCQSSNNWKTHWTIDVAQQRLWYCRARERENGWQLVETLSEEKMLNYWTTKITRKHRKPRREVAWFLKRIVRRNTSDILPRIAEPRNWRRFCENSTPKSFLGNILNELKKTNSWIRLSYNMKNYGDLWYASTDNTLLDQRKSSYHTHPAHPIIVFKI